MHTRFDVAVIGLIFSMADASCLTEEYPVDEINGHFFIEYLFHHFNQLNGLQRMSPEIKKALRNIKAI